MSLDQMKEELRRALIDAPLINNAAGIVNHAENTLSVMEVDSDVSCIFVGCGWFDHKTVHSTKTIL
jgi:hypothetical protein